MSASIVRLTESAFHEILQFVTTTSRFAERQPLVDSLRALATKVLNLDEMVIGRCGGEWNGGRQDRCSNFDQMMSMAEAAPAKPASPCSSGAAACGGGAARNPADFRSNEPAGRVVVCHRRIVDETSLCIVSSAKQRSHEELSALLKTLLPYLDEAFRRVDPSSSAHVLPPQLDSGEPIIAEPMAPLTSREREVLHWTAQGKGCWETGHIVGISERTVKFHLQNIYRKLNVVNRAQAVARAAQINLIQ
jgi:DNA-binding CsgD family transcriptional regulator